MANEYKSGRPCKAQSPFTAIFRGLIGNETQQEVANRVGVSRQNVGKWLSGETTPDINTLCKVADAYNVSTDYLLGRTPHKTPDINERAVCDYTGLSEVALEKASFLVNLVPEILKYNYNISELNDVNLLNEIIETDTFQQLIGITIDYCGLYLNGLKKKHIYAKEYDFILDEDIKEEFLENDYTEFIVTKKTIKTLKQLNTLLERLYNDYLLKESENNGNIPPKE